MKILKSALYSFIFLTASLLFVVPAAQAECVLIDSYPDSHSSTGCWQNNGCRQHSWGTLDVQCGAEGPDTARVNQYENNGGLCLCDGGSGLVQNNLVVLHNQTGDERYTENGCVNGNSGISIENTENVPDTDWQCDDLGGHLQFDAYPEENATFDINVVPGVTQCNWQVDNGGPSGSDDTSTDGTCSLTYEMNNSSWTSGVVIWMIAQPPELPCPIFDINCAANGRSATISWNPILGANNYGLYVNYNPTAGCWVCNLDGISGEEVRNNGILEDYWQWPLATTPTSKTIDTIPNATYGVNVQATRTGESGSSGACDTNQTFSCPGEIFQGECSDSCNVDSDCESGLVCDGTRGICVTPACEISQSCICQSVPNTTYCGDTTTQTQNQAGTGGPANDGRENCDVNDPTCHMTNHPTQNIYMCTWNTCGDGVLKTGGPNHNGITEQCDNGTYHPVTNPNGNSNESACDTQCRTRVNLSGSVHVGNGDASIIGGLCAGTQISNPSPEFVPAGRAITIAGINLPGNTKTTPLTDAGTFSTWILPGATVEVGPPSAISTYDVQCTNSVAPYAGWYRGSNKVARNQTGVKFFYVPGTTGEPWYQTVGGLVYSGGNLSSNLPNTTDFFSLRISTALTASIPWAAGTIDFGAGNATDRDVNSQQVASSDHDFNIEDYEYFTKKFTVVNNGTTIPDTVQIDTNFTCLYHTDGVTQICKNLSGNDVVLDFTGNTWNVQSNILIFVKGNLEIRDSSGTTDQLTNVPTDRFLGVIVDGALTIDSSVGNANVNSTTANLEGVFIARNMLVEGDTSGIDKRFIGEGSFITTEGTLTLERDLDTDNATLPAELFRYRSDFARNAPELFNSTTLEYEELN